MGIEIEAIALTEEVGQDIRLLSQPESINPAKSALEAVRAGLALRLGEHRVYTKDQGQVTIVGDGRDPNFEKWSVMIDGSVNAEDYLLAEIRETRDFSPLKDDETYELSQWIKDYDHQIPAEQALHIGQAVIEIISPVLPATEDGLQEISILYQWLNSQSIVVNRSCGLHVHVGPQKSPNLPGGYSPKLPLDRLKRLAQLTLCAEYQLSQFVPYHRLRNTYVKTNGDAALRLQDRAPAAAFRKIESIQDREELIRRMTSEHSEGEDQFGTKNCAVNFRRQRYDKSFTKDCRVKLAKTIEFRAGPATLSTEQAVAWTAFIKDLFHSTEIHPGPWEFLARYNENITPEDLLRDLGLAGYIGKLPMYRHTWEDFRTTWDTAWNMGIFTHPPPKT